MVKNPPTIQETWIRSLGWEDLQEKGTAMHSSILTWRIPWTEETDRLYSPWDHKESDTTEEISLQFKKVKKVKSSSMNLGKC